MFRPWLFGGLERGDDRERRKGKESEEKGGEESVIQWRNGVSRQKIQFDF